MIRSGILDAISMQKECQLRANRTRTCHITGVGQTLADHASQGGRDNMQIAMLSPTNIIEKGYGIFCHAACTMLQIQD